MTHRLFAYAAGSDLANVEAILVCKFEEFVRQWGVSSVRFRNVKAPALLGDQVMPDWNLGLSVETEGFSFEQLERLIAFLKAVAHESAQSFVLGTWSQRTSETEDLCTVDESTGLDAASTLLAALQKHPWSEQESAPRQRSPRSTILFEVDCRRKAAMFEKLVEQAPHRTPHGELSFNVQIDDNARHVCYVFLEWESLDSAHRFLRSSASQELVAEWPIEKVLGAIPLRDLGEQINSSEYKSE